MLLTDESARYVAGALEWGRLPPGGHPVYRKLLKKLWDTNDLPEFRAMVKKMLELHVRKGGDYGTETDIFANFRQAEQLQVPTVLGVLLRMGDKVSRLETFLRRGNLHNESVLDSMQDLACYALIGCVLWGEDNSPDGWMEFPIYYLGPALSREWFIRVLSAWEVLAARIRLHVPASHLGAIYDFNLPGHLFHIARLALFAAIAIEQER